MLKKDTIIYGDLSIFLTVFIAHKYYFYIYRVHIACADARTSAGKARRRGLNTDGSAIYFSYFILFV